MTSLETFIIGLILSLIPTLILLVIYLKNKRKNRKINKFEKLTNTYLEEDKYMSDLKGMLMAQLAEPSNVDQSLSNIVFTSIVGIQKQSYANRLAAMDLVSMIVAGKENFERSTASFNEVYEPLLEFVQKEFNGVTQTKLNELYKQESNDFIIEVQKAISEQHTSIIKEQKSKVSVLLSTEASSEKHVSEVINVKELSVNNVAKIADKNIIHKNKAARHKSRLNSAIKSM